MAKIEPQSSNDHQACLWGKLFKFLRFYEFQSNQANEWIKKEGGKIQKSQQQSFEKSKKTWKEVVHEESKKDPLFAEVYSAYQKFRDQYAIWGEKGYLK